MTLEAKPGKKHQNKDIINFDDVIRAALILKALNNPIRKKIIEYLLQTEISTVTDIVLNTKEKQTQVSQHLAVLRSNKIVTFLKKGKNVYYFLDKKRVFEIQKCLSSIYKNTILGVVKK